MEIEEVLAEIEFSLSLLEQPVFKVKPINLSFKKGWFSGIWAKYKPEWSSESVDVFIPHNELKKPYFLRSAAEKLVRNHTAIEVYPLRIDVNKQSHDSRKWQLPIFTMFSSDDRDAVVMEAEEIKLIDSDAEEINIKEEIIIERRDFKLEVIWVEYYQNKQRPRSIIFRITAPSNYPIIREEQRVKDLQRWEKLSQHNERRSSSTIRRFFYKKDGKNKVKIGRIKITLLPFFSKKEGKEMLAEGYVGKLRITYPKAIDLERGDK